MYQHVSRLYEAPWSEILDLIQEKHFLASDLDDLTPSYGDPGKSGDDLGGGKSYRL